MRVPVPRGRLSAVIVASVITALVVGVSPLEVTAAKAPPGLARFKAAVGSVESGGRYTARNRTSGAYGKYQIMPSNWPAWARQYLGNANARQTPRNQERVASGKMTSLFRWLGTWRRVAYWWLTGSSRRTGWSRNATRYVNKIMARYRGGGSSTPRATNTRVVGERSTLIVYHGTWRVARHGEYGGDTVRYATSRGAIASFTFTSRSVAWHGPTGPTRGKARVYIDGRLVKTVDLRRPHFDARGTLFSKRWSATAEHTIKIVVVGTRGRSMVAIDDFTIAR